jgi:phosphoglycerate dehydrogenase-like enzyme
MKALVFSSRSYSETALNSENASGRHHLKFLETKLEAATASLCAGYGAALVFVNDKVDRSCLKILAEGGTKLVATLSTGTNHIDLAAAKAAHEKAHTEAKTAHTKALADTKAAHDKALSDAKAAHDKAAAAHQQGLGKVKEDAAAKAAERDKARKTLDTVQGQLKESQEEGELLLLQLQTLLLLLLV